MGYTLLDDAPPSKGSYTLLPDSGPAPAMSPAPPVSRLTKLGKGMKDPVDGAAQLLTHLLPDSVVNAGNQLNNWLADKTGLVSPIPTGGMDQMVKQDEAAYQARRKAAGETGLDGYRLAGNFLSPVNLATAGGGGAAEGIGLGARMLASGARGAASATMVPVSDGDYWTQKAKQVGLGGAIGAAAPALGAALGRIISPNASTNPNLAMLADEGVQPTIGQTLGGRWNALEEKLQSVPILGDAIANARTSSLRQFNRAAINRAAGHVGDPVNDIGQAGVRQAGDAISNAYDNAANQIGGVKLDNQFGESLNQLHDMAQGLTTPMRDKFNSVVDQVLMRKVSPNGSILPDSYKAIDSELGNLAGRYGKSSVASEQELGDALTQLKSLLNQQMVRSNPDVADALAKADAGWANLVRVEQAAKAAKNSEGIFTPAQLNAAVQMADQSVRGRAVARGQALMQDLANAGQSVLGNKVPNSFTTDRALLAGGTLGSYAVNPAIPASLLGTAALYSSPAQRALTALLTKRPMLAQPAADFLRQTSPLLSAPGAQLGLGVMDQK